MSEKALGVSWRQLSEFAGIDLCRSYVLSWRLRDDKLMIDVDLCLEPEHPFYEAPLPAETACIWPAVIEFPACDRVGLNSAAQRKPSEMLEEIGLGAIADLRVPADGCYELRGEFGTVLISAELPILRLQGA